ncbi:bromodomain adjacent to zinc finger domain protein 2B isoform X2 [Gambusia affinis]|uniref:bromodomain adjacent to zinc finger domain protein 2B isoform X2 n=1 Tax=Gambusia affinis TaxID=33528 RepID=UPI001CDC3EFF|nr:bromodomain adjacent to zinc finger domain protein 2B isoform X2 [Gambusia affinis]
MDSKLGLASSSPAPPSFQKGSPVATFSSAPPQPTSVKYSPAHSPEGSIPFTIFGQTHQTGDELSNMQSCPAFGLLTSSSNCSEFVHRGKTGLMTTPTNTQFKVFPKLWRPTEMDNCRAGAIFHPLLGLYPFSVPVFKTHDPAHPQLCTSGVDRWNTSSSNRNLNTSLLPLKEKEKTKINSSWSQNSLSERATKTILSTKEKGVINRPLETPRCNIRLSGSLSESSSEETSSDSDNMEKDDEDLSSDSDDSEKEIPVGHEVETQMDSVKKSSFVRPKDQIWNPELFLNPHFNGVVSTADQDAPLALITKPRIQTNSPSKRPFLAATSPPYHTPVNLSISSKKLSDTSALPSKSAPSGLVPGSVKAASVLHGGWRPAKTSSCLKPVDLTRNGGFDFHSSRGSEDSSGDIEDDEESSLNSGSSLSDSGSNPESDSAEDHGKESFKAESHTDANGSGALLNLQILKNLGVSATNLLHHHGNLPDPLTFATAGLKKKRRVTDERALQLPLKFGWERETRMRTVTGRLQGEVAYFAPCGKKLRQYPDVVKYLVRHGITEISRDNFSFSTKIKVGNFYEGREGPEGLQWFLMNEEDISSCIIAMNGQHSRQTKSKYQTANNVSAAQHRHPAYYSEPSLQDISDSKLLRKLEAQEIARQAAQIKMMRKLEKQAIAQATKEAKKQQALRAAEERRKKREEMKIHKQQEKIKRIQHIRMEKELRAQQVLEAKRKKKEAAANVKMLEAEKRNQEREIRKLQSFLQKHQERERRRQHRTLMKAVEARRKAEEKERLRKEKKAEKQLNKKKKLELRRLKQKKAKELMKPKEDMCLPDHKPLPELPCIPGLILPGKTFSDCLMVLQFIRNFGAVLNLGLNSNQITISDMQDGLLNIGNSLQKVQDLLVSMLSAAVCDPGIPAGCKCKTLLGDHLTNVEINQDNVSEILQIYMEAHSEQTEVAALAHSLETKAFQAHSPSDKAAILAFLVNELCCSKAVISQIDKNIDYMTNLRKDKWAVEGKLRKLRNIHAKKTDERHIGEGEENHTFSSVTVQNKGKRKSRSSEEEDEDSEDQGEDYDGQEEEMRRKMKKSETYGEEEADRHSTDITELETKIQKTCKLQSEISQKLFEASHSLRSMVVGEDRYRRRYWLLPHCGGLFVEGVENELEEVEKDGGRQKASVRVKEEQQEKISQPRTESVKIQAECQQNNDDDLLQKSFSKLGKLFEAVKMDQNSNIDAENTHPSEVSITEPYHSDCTLETDKTSASSTLSAVQLNNNCMTRSPQSILPDNQLSAVLTEKSSEWFSLLPRAPCDGSSLVSNISCPAFVSSSRLVRTESSSSLLPNTPRKKNKAGINRLHSADSQEAEGNREEDLCLADCNSVDKSETTEPLNNKPACASFSPLEVAKAQDYICPQPVPEEMLRGWWRISDAENLQSLVNSLHHRGIRERVLQKQIQKNMEHMSQIYANQKNEFDTNDPGKQKISREIFEGWCVEQRAEEVDSNLLLQVEALEKNVISANLPIQGWMPSEPKYNSDDLGYFEHKPFSSVSLENKKQGETRQERLPGFWMRRSNKLLDVAVIRLAELERNIERSNKVEVAPGMRQWHKALGKIRNSAQLSLCIQHLQKSVVWKQDVMKVQCQLCQKGDNDELLLLCDGCDKGCHTYCHNPKITVVPAGAWFCSSCESGQIPPSGKQQSQTAGGKHKSSEVKQNCKPSVKGELVSEEVASSNNMPKRGSKEFKKRKGEDSSEPRFDSLVSCAKRAKTPNSELAVCRVLLAELEAHQDAWPFLSPVKLKSVPGYRKVIKKPMDFFTIKEKLINNMYLNQENFITDVNLVFDNCQKFNEDDSEIGQAGHRMKRFFDKRWTELLH